MTAGSHRVAGWIFVLAAFFAAVASESGSAMAADEAQTPGDVSRIVSIGGDVTEILYALKAAPKIVAVDTTSTFPPNALKEKTSIGYMRALSAEGILSTDPTVIIAAADAGPADVVSVLKASSVPYIEVPDDPTPEGVAAKIRLIAETIGAEAEADALVRDVARDFDVLASQRERITKPVRALFVLTVQNGRAVVGGRGTAADAIFALAGAENAAAQITGFKPLAEESAVDMAPDVIVTMSSRAPDHDARQTLGLPVFRSTPAASADRLVEMDGNYLLNFGPRAARAARDLMQTLYPELALSSKSSGQ
jgi:iron complex transport system substrate-binding protein